MDSPQPIVLIIFFCRDSETEQLALSAAVGAVQGRALIRLRRLPDSTADDPPSNEHLARMQREYVPPAENDILNAHGLILAAPPDYPISSPAWKGFLDLIKRMGAEGKLQGKVASGFDVTTQFLNELGFIPLSDSSESALALGRAVADAARASAAATKGA